MQSLDNVGASCGENPKDRSQGTSDGQCQCQMNACFWDPFCGFAWSRKNRAIAPSDCDARHMVAACRDELGLKDALAGQCAVRAVEWRRAGSRGTLAAHPQNIGMHFACLNSPAMLLARKGSCEWFPSIACGTTNGVLEVMQPLGIAGIDLSIL
eukprot:4514434-Amphidinium_carterae.1